jgi:hypothetical protein
MANTPRFSHWDAANVSIVFGGILIDGFADGEGASITFNEDAYTLTVGIDGRAVRNKMNNRSARLTLNLLGSSATNDALSAVYNLDQAINNGAGVAPLIIRDNNGRTVITAAEAWVARPPDFTMDAEVGTKTWEIDCAQLEVFFGGL